MAIREEVKQVISEMIKIQQVLRATSPKHDLNSRYRAQVIGAIAKSEELLRQMKEDKSLENSTGQA